MMGNKRFDAIEDVAANASGDSGVAGFKPLHNAKKILTGWFCPS
jgi:hypothetical protein